jgi:hypothetical protein
MLGEAQLAWAQGLAANFSNRASVNQYVQLITMPPNAVNPFEYVSILVSIILGLGITQLLSAFADLLYRYQQVKFYWPHTLWVIFILFLHIQDWFIMYQLQTMKVWSLPTMMFILAYPVTLFICAKLLLPTSDREEKAEMKKFYFAQFPVLFFFVSLSILLSILFNIFLLARPWAEQSILIVFLLATGFLAAKKTQQEWPHQLLAVLIVLGAIAATVVEKNEWVVK